MSLHISKAEARNEAMRIASEFVAAQFAEDLRWDWECGEPHPDVFSSNYRERKTVTRWSVAVRIIPKDGGTFDGGPIVLVDILTKEARFQ